MNKLFDRLSYILFALFLGTTFLSSYLTYSYSTKISIIFLLIGATGSFILFWRTNEKRYKAIFEDLKKFQLAVINASDMIVITDPKGTIIFANKAMENITGYKTEEVLGKNPRLWGGLMAKDFYSEMWSSIKGKKPFKGELNNRRKNGEIYTANLHVSPVVDEAGEVVFFVGIERDVTRERDIDKAKTEFVSLASHQLRTPLTGISLSSELLLRSAKNKIDEKEQKYLAEINKSTQRMSDLINDLLNISRIELGTFSLKPQETDLASFTNRVLDELSEQIKFKNLSITRVYDQKQPTINWDRDVLRMIIENLISNAIRYTSQKGKIAIDIGKTSEGVLFKIEDDGCGIPLKDRDKIFTKLYRAENAKEACAEGTGLGLYIVKSVADKTGAKIWFQSVEKKGTAFFVLFPSK